MDHFNIQSLTPTHQNATETRILHLCDNILINTENNENTIKVALDLSVAFDTVNHKILIKILENYFGIWDKASEQIMSYLPKRQFKV